MARMARTNSRMRAAGCDHGIENRFVMCGLICEPRPRMNRPLENACRSLAVTAVVIGLRANATAMLVPSWMRSVACAASSKFRNGSWLVSADHTPSYPWASASRADAPLWARSNEMPPSTFMGIDPTRSRRRVTFAPGPGGTVIAPSTNDTDITTTRAHRRSIDLDRAMPYLLALGIVGIQQIFFSVPLGILVSGL